MRAGGWRSSVVCLVTVVALMFAPAGAGALSPKWALVTTKVSSLTQMNQMTGVSCLSSTFCMAVGGYYVGDNQSTEMQRWNGTSWGIVASPNKTGTTVAGDYLNGISCVSTSFCMAVGFYQQSGGRSDESLIERWNGTKWSIVPSPNVASVSNDLDAVSCYSTTFCMAVGATLKGTSFLAQTTAQKWNGSTWSLLQPKNTSTSFNNHLWGVSCSKASFCMAVGYYDTATTELGLTERSNGSAWAIVTSPKHSGGPTKAVDDLWSVSCVKNTTTFCMAAGDYVNTSSAKQTLVERFNGSSWTMLSSPNKSTTQSDGLGSAVSCSATNFCMDSTFSSPNTGHELTAILHWNGTSVSFVASPNATNADNILDATSCVTSAFCMAVGLYTPTTGIWRNLAEAWR
jgi:hypothetical protein